MTNNIRFDRSHRKRLEDCLSGENMSTPPVALWRHFPVDDQSPDRLAAAIINFQTTFDYDLVKVTPASSFCLRDWGIQDEWKGDPEGTRTYSDPIIHNAENWADLPVLNPTKGFLGQQLEVLRIVTSQFSPRTPVLQTIFSPMAQAKNLTGQESLLAMMRSHPESLHAGLRTITRTTTQFIQACVEVGIDGIFYAIQHAQSSLLSETEFDVFCRPYDLEILSAAQSLWLNMVHIHGEDIYFSKVTQYPVQVLNWHDRQTFPGISEARNQFPGVICGGLSRFESMVLGNPDVINFEAKNAIFNSGGSRFILGTGCVVPITAPYGNLLAARNSVFQA